MTRRWCGHIHGIHVWIIYQFLGIGVPFADAVLYGITAGMILRATHHSHHTGTLNLAESRTAFLLGYLTASDESPM
jgi:hypothetical protein